MGFLFIIVFAVIFTAETFGVREFAWYIYALLFFLILFTEPVIVIEHEKRLKRGDDNGTFTRKF